MGFRGATRYNTCWSCSPAAAVAAATAATSTSNHDRLVFASYHLQHPHALSTHARMIAIQTLSTNRTLSRLPLLCREPTKIKKQCKITARVLAKHGTQCYLWRYAQILYGIAADEDLRDLPEFVAILRSTTQSCETMHFSANMVVWTYS